MDDTYGLSNVHHKFSVASDVAKILGSTPRLHKKNTVHHKFLVSYDVEKSWVRIPGFVKKKLTTKYSKCSANGFRTFKLSLSNVGIQERMHRARCASVSF